jgi:hypothetical protein
VSDKAYRYAMQAGESATSVYAQDEATAFFTMAQRHAATPTERLEALFGAAKVAEVSGRYADAVELCKTALNSAGADAPPRERLPTQILHERVQGLLGKPLTQVLEAYQALLKQAEELGLEKERVSLLTMPRSRTAAWAIPQRRNAWRARAPKWRNASATGDCSHTR